MKEMTQILHNASTCVADITKGFGAPVVDLTEIDGRLKKLDYLKNQIGLLEAIQDHLRESEKAEKDAIDTFISDQDRKLTAARSALGGSAATHTNIQPPVVEKHIPLRIPESPLSPPPMRNGQSADRRLAEQLSAEINRDVGEPDEPAETRRENTSMWVKVASGGKPATRNNDVQSVVGRGVPLVAKEVAEDVYLPSVEIPTMADCVRRPGFLCWAQKEQTFCISINNLPISLGPGLPKIFAENQPAVKVVPHNRIKAGQKVDAKNFDKFFFIPDHHAEQEFDERNLINKMKYSPASYGYGKQYDYFIRIGDRDNYTDDVKHLTPYHPDFIYFQNLATGHFLTYLTVRTEFTRRSNRK